jgi:hypothetical protein
MFYRQIFRLARWLALEKDDATMQHDDRKRDPLQSLGHPRYQPTAVRSSRRRIKGRRTTG